MTVGKSPFRVALVQMRSTRDPSENLEAATWYIREAAEQGAQYVQTPENTLLMEADPDRKREIVRSEAETPALATFAGLARELGIWLHIGSIAIKLADGRAANRAFLFSPQGEMLSRYDKIHLFDVNLPGGETYRESDTFIAGNEAVVAQLPWCKLGVTICYDLRFPHLFSALAQAGATVLTAPAAFTKVTGEAHWHILLRARAIENACFMLAAAQGGRHASGRSTFGHSLVISPWGEILAEAGEDPSVIVANLDLEGVARARQRIPVLNHVRAFTLASNPE